MLEVFLLLPQHPELKGMTARTLRALWHARFDIDDTFRRDPANRALFLHILQAPQGITHALRRMNQTSILGRYLPNFRRIVGQMQHDLFHVYTVDQHILMVVRNVRRFTLSEHAHEYPFCSQLDGQLQRSRGCSTSPRCSTTSPRAAAAIIRNWACRTRVDFCVDHALTEEQTELVVFLVEHHLTMSQVAQKQDLSDPDVIAQFRRGSSRTSAI